MGWGSMNSNYGSTYSSVLAVERAPGEFWKSFYYLTKFNLKLVLSSVIIKTDRQKFLLKQTFI